MSKQSPAGRTVWTAIQETYLEFHRRLYVVLIARSRPRRIFSLVRMGTVVQLFLYPAE